MNTERHILYTEYRDLLSLYTKQLIKTDELQRENTALYNLILGVDN